MRLRYLKLKNYPPLNDIAISFSADSPLDRECAIRFVVGVNGSGKTHLLQAVTETFISIARQTIPNFPVTLIYELGKGEKQRTLIFDSPGQGRDEGWWQSEAGLSKFESDLSEEDWARLVETVRSGIMGWNPLIQNGNWPGKKVGLPKAVLAYTTGEFAPWETLFHYEPQATEVDINSQSEDYDFSLERPPGWNRTKELEYRSRLDSEEDVAEVNRLGKLEDEFSSEEQEQELCLLITPKLLKSALISVTLKQAMSEFKCYKTDSEISAFIDEINSNPDAGIGLRRLLSQVGWVWPVCLVFEVAFSPDKWSQAEARQKRDILKKLYSIATEVVREPEPSTTRRLFFDLKARFDPVLSEGFSETEIWDYSSSPEAFEFVGEALLHFLGGLDAEPFDYFQQLLSLNRMGLLTDVHVALRKADVDDILMFGELSDGEQVYLGRMALFHLMKNQDDVLILLDEPETHFNDIWKREIVGIIDGVLKDQASDVVISTHSSIALTDVFDHEIELIKKKDGNSYISPLTSTTFGADPSEIMINVFDAPDSIGSRALTWLNQQVDKKWEPEQQKDLEAIIRKIGPGLHRSELRTIWRRLNAAQD